MPWRNGWVKACQKGATQGLGPSSPSTSCRGQATFPSPDGIRSSFPKDWSTSQPPNAPLSSWSPLQTEHVNGVGTPAEPARQGLSSASKSVLPFRINRAAVNYLASRPPIVLPLSSSSREDAGTWASPPDNCPSFKGRSQVPSPLL